MGTLWAATRATRFASEARAVMAAGSGGVAASAAARAANSSPRNQGSYSHQGQQRPANPDTEPHKKTHRNASCVLRGAVRALGAGRGPDAVVGLDPTGFGPKAAQTEHAEGIRKGPGGRRNRHLRFWNLRFRSAQHKLSPLRQRAPVTYSIVWVVFVSKQSISIQLYKRRGPLTSLGGGGAFACVVVVKQ